MASSGVGKTIPSKFAGFSDLADQIKAYKKEAREALKEIETLKKAGKDASAVVSKLQSAQNQVRQLEKIQQTQGAQLKAQEKANNAYTSNYNNLNFGAMAHNQITSYLSSKGALGKGILSAYNNGIDGALEIASPHYRVAKQLAKGINDFASAVSPYSEAFRQREADFNVAMSDASFTDGESRRLAGLQFANEKRLQKYRGIAGLTGETFADALSTIEGRLRGTDEASLAKDLTRQDIRRAGDSRLEDEEKLRDLAELRVMSDRFGNTAVGALGKNFNDILRNIGLTSNSTEGAITETVRNAIAKFKEYESIGMQRVASGDFAGANKAFEAAGKEIGAPPNAWRDPATEFSRMMQEKQWGIGWSLSQNALPAYRIGM